MNIYTKRLLALLGGVMLASISLAANPLFPRVVVRAGGGRIVLPLPPLLPPLLPGFDCGYEGHSRYGDRHREYGDRYRGREFDRRWEHDRGGDPRRGGNHDRGGGRGYGGRR